MSPHILTGHCVVPVGEIEEGRVHQSFSFSNEGFLTASFKPDGSDMKIIELSKLSLSFTPGDEERTFSIEFLPE